MTDFTITEDFPKSEIEFDQRFSDPKACYEYLFKQKWPTGFICKTVRPYQVLGQCPQSLYLHPLSAQPLLDCRYDYGQY